MLLNASGEADCGTTPGANAHPSYVWSGVYFEFGIRYWDFLGPGPGNFTPLGMQSDAIDVHEGETVSYSSPEFPTPDRVPGSTTVYQIGVRFNSGGGLIYLATSIPWPALPRIGTSIDVTFEFICAGPPPPPTTTTYAHGLPAEMMTLPRGIERRRL
jgi:hypothetical protein